MVRRICPLSSGFIARQVSEADRAWRTAASTSAFSIDSYSRSVWPVAGLIVTIFKKHQSHSRISRVINLVFNLQVCLVLDQVPLQLERMPLAYAISNRGLSKRNQKSHAVGRNHRIIDTRMPLTECILFAARSTDTDCGPSMTSSVTPPSFQL